MLSQLLILIKDIWLTFRWQSVLFVMLLALNGCLEGIGFALLFPLMGMIGIGSGGTTNLVGQSINSSFAGLGIQPSMALLLGLVISAFLAQNLIFLVQSWLAARLQHQYVRNWRYKLFSSFLQASWHFFIERKAGHLMNGLVQETNRLGGAFYQVFHLASASMITLIYLTLAFAASWQATAIIIGTGLFLAFVTSGLVRGGYRIGNQISEASNELEFIAHETLSGAKVLKATSTEPEACQRFAGVIDSLARLYFWSSFNPNILKAVFEFSGILLMCGLLYVGVARLSIDPSVILVIMALFIRLLPRLYSLQQNLQLLGIYLPALSSILEMHNAACIKTEFLETTTEDKIPAGPAALELRGLNYAYDDRQVLHEISLTIKPGWTVGVVGSSGSGKSTLVDCLLRLNETEPGMVMVNGQPLHAVGLRSWRQRVGYVAQETFLFHDTINANLTWGANSANEAAIRAAAIKAHADDFIRELPDGYLTEVGDRGVRLSGGQRQRLGLARALLRQPSLLVLDETTSALDAEAEQHVLRAIDKLHGETTIIIIAHRLSTVRNADRIFVLEEGRLVEQGSWNELAGAEGRFRQLMRLQGVNTGRNV